MEQQKKVDGLPIPKKLYRSVNDRWFYGVIGGIAKFTGIDSNLLRIIAIVIGNGGGTGIVAYFLLAMYLPEDPGETKNSVTKPRQFSFGKLLLVLILLPIGLILFFLIALAIFGALIGYKG